MAWTAGRLCEREDILTLRERKWALSDVTRSLGQRTHSGHIRLRIPNDPAPKLELDLLVIVFIFRHINGISVHVAGTQLVSSYFSNNCTVIVIDCTQSLTADTSVKRLTFSSISTSAKVWQSGVTSIVTICCSKSRCSLYANNNGPCALERPWRDSPTRKCPLLGSALYYYIGRAEVIRFRYHRAHYSIQKSSICTQRKRAGIDSNLVSTKKQNTQTFTENKLQFTARD